jgi:hypothetical protein
MDIDYNYFYDKTNYRNDYLTEDENIVIDQLLHAKKSFFLVFVYVPICSICNIDYCLQRKNALRICYGTLFCYPCLIKCLHYAHQHIKQHALQKIFTRFLFFRETVIRQLLVNDVSNYIFLLSVIK